jgi:adenine deaminase
MFHTRPDPQLLAVARGDAPADLVLRNLTLANVFSGELEATEIALWQGRIAGVGPGYEGRVEEDLQGALVTPGLIDAHVHIESSLCTPPHFAAALLPRGVTTVITDPHEIANVAGAAGIRYMAALSRGLPLSVVIMAPSCVPATAMETTGARLDAAELAALLADGTVHGLAELMNYPGAALGDPAVLAKLAAFAGRPQDGHAPAMRGKWLNAYAATGIGSEHECTSVEEAAEKLAKGFYILIREATNARNLHPLLPLINSRNSRRIAFCTDDRVPGDLLDQGSVDYMVREAIRAGVDPLTALQMATLNTADWFDLRDRGAVAPGRRADLLITDSLANLQPRWVMAGGQIVARDGQLGVALGSPAAVLPEWVSRTVKLAPGALDLRIAARGEQMRVIGSLPDQLVTEHRLLAPTVAAGEAVADPARDLLKMAVIERHTGSGGQGLGFIQGIGLQRGAMAGTVAHDHHNLVLIGANDDDMRTAAHAVAAMGGGLALVEQGRLVAALPLPVAGLMSDRPIQEVRQGYDTLLAGAHALGSPLHDPYMAMSFMALEVIPKLKLTDKGLVDVERFKLVDLFA